MVTDVDLENSILFEEDKHSKTKFKEQLNYFRTANKFTDIVINTMDGKRFAAHKAVLAASCSYFRQKFEVHPKVTSISERMTSRELQFLLEYIYTAKIYISSENACCIHSFSTLCQFHDLSHKALEVMINNIDPEKCLQYWRYSSKNKIENLKMCCLEFIRSDTEIFLEHNINKFNFDEIYQICSMENLSCQVDILFRYTIIIWTKQDFSTRKKCLKLLLSMFDINLMPHYFVEEIILDDLLMKCEDYKKWISLYKRIKKNF